MPDARYGALAPVTFRMGGMQVQALYYGADLIWPAGHIISIPADEINWTDYAPLILSGVNVRVPVDVVSWQDFEPGIELDGITVPVDRLDWTDYAPSVSSGAHVHVPLDVMQWADFAPVVGTSAIVDMPLDALAWVDYAPTVSAGARVSLPFDAISWADFTPLVVGGASVSLPVDAWKWGDYSPNLGYAFSKAFSKAFNAIPHDYGVVVPVDEMGWADYAPDVDVPPPYEAGVIQQEVFVTDDTFDPGTNLSITNISWGMAPHETRAVTVVVIGNTGRTGDPSVTLRNASNNATIAEFDTQYLYKLTPTNTNVVLIATVRIPTGGSHTIRINTPGSAPSVRNLTVAAFTSRHMDSFVPVDTYYNLDQNFSDQFTQHPIDTQEGGFVIGAINRNDAATSPYPTPMYNFSPDWVSQNEAASSQNSRRRIVIRGISPDRSEPQELVFDRRTTKECLAEEVHLISLR